MSNHCSAVGLLAGRRRRRVEPQGGKAGPQRFLTAFSHATSRQAFSGSSAASSFTVIGRCVWSPHPCGLCSFSPPGLGGQRLSFQRPHRRVAAHRQRVVQLQFRYSVPELAIRSVHFVRQHHSRRHPCSTACESAAKQSAAWSETAPPGECPLPGTAQGDWPTLRADTIAKQSAGWRLRWRSTNSPPPGNSPSFLPDENTSAAHYRMAALDRNGLYTGVTGPILCIAAARRSAPAAAGRHRSRAT